MESFLGCVGGTRYDKDCKIKLVTLSMIVEIMVWGRFLALIYVVLNNTRYSFVPLEIYHTLGDKFSPSSS